MFYSIIKTYTYTKMDELRIACQKTLNSIYTQRKIFEKKKIITEVTKIQKEENKDYPVSH